MSKCNGLYLEKDPKESFDWFFKQWKFKFKQSKLQLQVTESAYFVPKSENKRRKKLNRKYRVNKIRIDD